MHRALFLVLVALSACGPAPTTRPDAGKPKPDGFYGDDFDAGDPLDPLDAGTDAGSKDAGPPCISGTRTQVILDCLNAGRSPDQCALEQGTGINYCDSDGDGVFDDLETALGYAYAPVFALNGGGYGGNPETDWPANTKHFVTHSQLSYRPDGQSAQLVLAGPTLDAIWQASVSNGGAPIRAYDPATAAGGSFWLCLNDATSSTRVSSKADMLALPDGIDVLSIVHPANGNLGASTHLMVATGLFFAYNAFAGIDNHEGDWESVALFVNRSTGAVDSAYFDRHDTTDSTRFVDVATYGAENAATSAPNVSVSSSDPSVHGLRFLDYSGRRHHLVVYVGTGSHAMYDYPGNTLVKSPAPRDTHSGDGDKLFVWTNSLSASYAGTNATYLKARFFNPGEQAVPTVDWARFKGQWGCDNEAVAKSWPGPFGNARHPRPLFTQYWGSPPVAPP